MKFGIKVALNALTVSYLVIWTVLTILAVTWGIMYNWPDFVHVNYGFPFVWATHTLNTIAGPVDLWRVNLQALFMDLALWLGIMIVAVTLILQISSRKAKAGS